MHPLYRRSCLGRELSGQRGLVLFISLIVLMVMTLAGMSLMRTAETSTLVVTNFSHKQASLSAADRGLEQSYQWLVSQAGNVILNSDNAANAYLARRPDTEPDWFNDATWLNQSLVARAPNHSTDADTLGNTVSYRIVRLCTSVGAPTRQNCVMSTEGLGSSNAQAQEGDSNASGETLLAATNTPLVYYALYVRVRGPNNTNTVVQSTVGIPQV
jgi:type IV pilus assembly protein PilX